MVRYNNEKNNGASILKLNYHEKFVKLLQFSFFLSFSLSHSLIRSLIYSLSFSLSEMIKCNFTA